MTFVIPDGFCQVTLNFTGAVFHKGVAATVFGVQHAAVPLSDVGTAIEDAWNTNMQPLQNSEVTLENANIVTQLTRYVQPMNSVGTRSGDMSPPNVSILVNYDTGLRGPKNRGRAYFPGMLNDGDVEDTGAISPTRLGALGPGVFAFGSDVATAGFAFYILHRDNSAPTAVTGGTVSGKVATQRRRLR